MDPKTESEQMEDNSAPKERGFISDDISDEDAREALEQEDESDEDCD